MKKEVAAKMKGFPVLQQMGRQKPQTSSLKIPKEEDIRLNYQKAAGQEKANATNVSSAIAADLKAINYPFHRLRRSFAEHSLTSVESRTHRRFPLYPISDRGTTSSEAQPTSGTSYDPQSKRDVWSSWTLLATQRAETSQRVGKFPIIQHFYDNPKLSTSVDGTLVISPSLHPMTNVDTSNLESPEGQKVPWYITVLQEKERCLMMLGEEINRLSKWEVECARKNDVISILREEIQHLQIQLDQMQQEDICKLERGAILDSPQMKIIKDQSPYEREETEDISDKEDSIKDSQSISDGAAEMEVPCFSDSLAAKELFELETEIQEEGLKASAFLSETEFIKYVQREKGIRTEMENLQRQNQRLQAEVAKVSHDYGISTGAITSLQRQLFLLEAKLRKTEAEKQKLEKELKERGIQLQAMSTKFSNLHDERKNEELLAKIEQENYNLRQHVSELRSELEERDRLITESKNEIEKQEREAEENRKQLKWSILERKEVEDKVEALQHLEHKTKVSLEYVLSRFERFRNKLVQTTYSSPGTKSPIYEINDGEVLDALQKIIAERAEYLQLLKQHGIKIPSPVLLDPSPSISPRLSPSKKSLGK